MIQDHEAEDLLRALRRAHAEPVEGLEGRLRALGLLYAGVPAPHGPGGSLALPLLVVEECARHLTTPPWPFTGVLAARTLTAAVPGVGSADETAGLLLDDLLAGAVRPAVRWPGVLGTDALAIDGVAADHLVDVRTGSDGTVAVTVLDLAGAQRIAAEGLDPTRPLAAVDAEAAPVLLSVRLGPDAARSLRAFWLLVVAADCLGVMQAGLGLAIDHARGRLAFGRPIGSFQAVRHRCAELFVDVEATRAAVTEGGATWAAGRDEDLVFALAAASSALDAVVRVAEAVVLLHGAMGFTREAPPQAYLRRAYALQALAPQPRVLHTELVTA